MYAQYYAYLYYLGIHLKMVNLLPVKTVLANGGRYPFARTFPSNIFLAFIASIIDFIISAKSNLRPFTFIRISCRIYRVRSSEKKKCENDWLRYICLFFICNFEKCGARGEDKFINSIL